jgi:hypothetical protein
MFTRVSIGPFCVNTEAAAVTKQRFLSGTSVNLAAVDDAMERRKIRKRSNSESYTPSLEPFGIYQDLVGTNTCRGVDVSLIGHQNFRNNAYKIRRKKNKY